MILNNSTQTGLLVDGRQKKNYHVSSEIEITCVKVLLWKILDFTSNSTEFPSKPLLTYLWL